MERNEEIKDMPTYYKEVKVLVEGKYVITPPDATISLYSSLMENGMTAEQIEEFIKKEDEIFLNACLHCKH